MTIDVKSTLLSRYVNSSGSNWEQVHLKVSYLKTYIIISDFTKTKELYWEGAPYLVSR